MLLSAVAMSLVSVGSRRNPVRPRRGPVSAARAICLLPCTLDAHLHERATSSHEVIRDSDHVQNVTYMYFVSIIIFYLLVIVNIIIVKVTKV